MKIRPVGSELFHADSRTDRHDENKSLFEILGKRLKKKQVFSLSVFKNGPLNDGTDRLSRNVGNNQRSQFPFSFEIPIFPPF
jgi:hypothetical protein